MDTELLRTFLAVHRTGHFARAAERLCVTPSAVSARIRLLEQQLGVELFERERNNIRLTTAGARLLPRAETLVALWERTRREMTGSSTPERLTAAAPPSLWETRLPTWLGWICRESTLQLQLDSLATDQVVQRLGIGVLDIGFLYDVPGLPGLEVQELGAVALVMVCTSARGLEQALARGYVQVAWGAAIHARQRELTAGIEPRARVMTAQTALTMLEQAGGCAYLPAELVEQRIREGRLHPVPDAPPLAVRAYAAFDPNGPHAALIGRSVEAMGKTYT